MKKLMFILFALSTLILTTQCGDKEDEDITAPIIILEGSSKQYVPRDSVYTDPGYTATDDVDGDLTDLVKVTGSVDVSTDGTYLLNYNVIDASGNAAEEVQREVIVMVF